MIFSSIRLLPIVKRDSYIPGFRGSPSALPPVPVSPVIFNSERLVALTRPSTLPRKNGVDASDHKQIGRQQNHRLGSSASIRLLQQLGNNRHHRDIQQATKAP